MSRHEILEWVNSRVQFKVAKLEELCSGAEYCQMLEQIHPNCIGLKRVKFHAKLEHEYLHNFKLLQAAFTRMGIDKVVPVDRLIKGRFQDNLEFIQWFRKFYENSPGVDHKLYNKENNSVPIIKPHAAGKDSKSHFNKEAVRAVLEPKDNIFSDPPSPSSLEVFKEQKEEMEKGIAELNKDRDFYLSKLTAIEKLLSNAIKNNEKTEWCQRALKKLYDSNEDELKEA